MNSPVLLLVSSLLAVYAVSTAVYYFARLRPRLRAAQTQNPPAVGCVDASDGDGALLAGQALSPELLRALSEWRYTFDAIIDPVLILDNDLRIVKGNRAALQLLSVNGSPLEGKTCHQLFAGSDMVCPLCPVQTVRHEKKPHRQEITHRYLGRTFAVSCAPLTLEQGVVGYVYSAKDISVQRNLEKRLVHAHKLESIATLAGGIAHDFNNILGAILGNADLLLYQIGRAHV